MGDERDVDLTIEAPGADEVAVLPWPSLFRHRLVRRVESSDRYEWWVLWTVLAGLFSVGFTDFYIMMCSMRVWTDLRLF